MKLTKQLKADMALLLITIGWGSSFILTKNALGDLATYNFLAVRFLLAFTIASLIFYKRFASLTKETLVSGLGVVTFSPS